MQWQKYIWHTKCGLGTCGSLPMPLLSTRIVLLGQTTALVSLVCLSAWLKGWCLERGGSLASPPASPTTHSFCFGDVRSLLCHLWTCPPQAVQTLLSPLTVSSASQGSES